MELAGPKIQGNPYKLSDYKIYLFDVFDIDSGEYMSPYDRYLMVSDIDIPHVPIVDSRWEMSMTCTMDVLLEKVFNKLENGVEERTSTYIKEYETKLGLNKSEKSIEERLEAIERKLGILGCSV